MQSTANQALTGTGAIMQDVANTVVGLQVNVLYKAFILVAVLMVLAVIPATSKYAGITAWGILLLLLVQRHP